MQRYDVGAVLWLYVGCSQPDKFNDSGSSASTVSQPQPTTLFLQDLIEPDMAGIWNGLVPLDDEGFVFSTMALVEPGEPMQLTIRHMNWDLTTRDIDGQSFVAVTKQTDLPIADHITDHAIVRMNDSLYLAYTGNVQNYLQLVKTDLYGARESFVVLYDEAPLPANDMMIVAADDQLCMRIGTDGANKFAVCLDPETLEIILENPIQTPVVTGNLGSAVYHNEEFKVFSGGFDQRDLTVTHYDSQWQPKDPFEQIIVSSENREWNWAASGSTYISDFDMWAVAYTNMPANGQADFDARGRLDLYDADWNLIDRSEFGEMATHRPHLLWKSPHLLLSYDAGPVVIRRYELQ